jgi:hypothetical protein
MELNVGPDASLDNIYDWEGMGEITGEVSSTKPYITNKTSAELLRGFIK